MAETTTAAWQRVLADPQLRNLPYKVETNARGQIILSPHKPRHSLQQGRLVQFLYQYEPEPGEAAVEFAIDTPNGVKVPDVVWLSPQEIARLPEDAEAAPFAPSVCVEVLSEGNTPDEIARKRALYFAHGAREVWTCDASGSLVFYVHGEPEPATRSQIMRDCPTHIRRLNEE